jgi:predicted nucleotidyltransferase
MAYALASWADLNDDRAMSTPPPSDAASPVPLPPEVLAPICRRHGVRRLAVFGSRLKGTARPDSDLDLLVEFEPDRVPGLLGLSAIQIELTQALGVQVDLRTPQELSRYFRDEVLQQAQVAYGA